MRSVSIALLCVALIPLFVQAQDTQAQTDQREFTTPTPLLDADGSLAAWGWAKRAIFEYNRSAIPTAQHARIKEWEHYTVMSPEFTVGVTIVQLGPLLACSGEVIDYESQSIKSAMFITPTPMDKSALPADPYSDTRITRGNDFVSFAFDGKRRQIDFHFSKSALGAAIEGSLELYDDPEDDSVAITRPFAEPGQFFYENKIFGMPATGSVTVDGQEYVLPEGNSSAIFDWGRGIWPRDSKWFWGQAAGKVGEHQVAINLGHGYGDDAHGTCNAILVDGRLHKLDIVDCEFNQDDRMQPWQFTSNDERLTLSFRPIYQQHSKTDLGFLHAELYKIHGYYSGTLVLDDGTRLEVKDLLGFAEHMEQRW